MTRKTPSWFTRALRSINPHFSAKWNDAKGVWEIQEAVRHSTLVASMEGAAVYRMHRRPETALRFADIGSRLLMYVRRNDPRRYNSVQQMVKKLRIDEGVNPLAA